MGKGIVKPGEPLYDVIIPKVYGDKGDNAMYVSVNDEAIRIKYGERVRIPERFKEAIDEAFRAEGLADSYAEEVRFKESK